ncbi:MAG: hypothetical protein MR600_09560, partial [Subdoligranulum sp.]|nr:hypothetical protein [Subdoligranulum sp.]
PGRGARKAFEAYARAAIEDYCGNCPDCTFAQAAEQIGGKPYEAVQDFLESQPPEIVTVWQAQAVRRKKCVFAAMAAVILLLAGIVAFYFKTNGVLIVNTKTTITDFTDSDLTCEEITELVLSRAQEEGQQNG